ncbi:MAG TPA: glycosyltransferase family A protein, partial [Planctomycetota bacterium]|nr:glycosyltransferase family A protein [Planctomycetota bacterium]
WRGLYRQVMRDHLWCSDERASLLGRDPCSEDFDRPRMSAVMISKRPHLLAKCLETFRGQSWPDRELVLVLNVDTLPDELPPLCENERLFVVPEHFNIGRCLNMAIDAATGHYWAKMDDDDYYSATYLEEYAWYYRATQADTLGRQSVYFYFDGADCTKARFSSVRRCRRALESGEFVAGASLSGQRQASLPRFSNHYRNSADFYWMKSLWEKGKRIFSYDSTSIVVFRDASEDNHTWMASGVSAMTREFSTLTQGNIFPRIEKGDPVLCRAESREGREEEGG